MKFTSERLMFRELTQSDFQLFYSVLSNEHVMNYTLMDKYACEKEALPYFNKILKNNTTPENRQAYEYAVFSTSNDAFVGFADIELHRKNTSGGCGEIGYLLLPDFWGKGYASEIAKALITYSFAQLGLHRVSARCNSNNKASENVMKKAGMTKEGEFRKVRFKHGRWVNELHYSILIDEWKLQISE